MQRRLRIAYIAARWDYGDSERGPSFEEVTFRSTLEGAGHDVHAYDFLTRFKDVGRAAMNAELERFVRELEPDFAMFVLFKDEILPRQFGGLRTTGSARSTGSATTTGALTTSPATSRLRSRSSPRRIRRR